MGAETDELDRTDHQAEYDVPIQPATLATIEETSSSYRLDDHYVNPLRQLVHQKPRTGVAQGDDMNMSKDDVKLLLALEFLCTQLSEYDIPIRPATLVSIEALGPTQGLDARYVDWLKELVRDV